MREQDLRGTARRNWASIARAKLAFCSRQKLADGPAPVDRATEMLRLFSQAEGPAPATGQRWQDLAQQIRLKRRIGAAGARFRATPEVTTRTTRIGRA